MYTKSMSEWCYMCTKWFWRIYYSGLRCEDRDGCASQPCKNNGICVSSSGGGYTCQCLTGFEGPTCEQGRSIVELVE
jgi:hypothetical protein